MLVIGAIPEYVAYFSAKFKLIEVKHGQLNCHAFMFMIISRKKARISLQYILFRFRNTIFFDMSIHLVYYVPFFAYLIMLLASAV